MDEGNSIYLSMQKHIPDFVPDVTIELPNKYLHENVALHSNAGPTDFQQHLPCHHILELIYFPLRLIKSCIRGMYSSRACDFIAREPRSDARQHGASNNINFSNKAAEQAEQRWYGDAERPNRQPTFFGRKSKLSEIVIDNSCSTDYLLIF